MTPVQIGYFKHFMYDSGIARQYIITYNKHHYGANPHSVEEWLQKAAVRQVIMDAFAFQLNHAYGYDYWKGVDEKWYEYWKMHENNFSNINYVFLKGTFAILRQNWDSPKYFEKETKSATYKRMNMTPPDGFVPDEEKEVTRQDLPLHESAEVSEEPEQPAAATVPAVSAAARAACFPCCPDSDTDIPYSPPAASGHPRCR